MVPIMDKKSNQTEKFLPIWVWIVALIEIVLVLFFSVGTAMNPGDFIPGGSELDYVTQLYITRNVTVVLGLIIALLLKSHKALFVVLTVRVLTDLSDVITVYALNVEVIKSSVPMVVVILIIPALFVLGYLCKRINQESQL